MNAVERFRQVAENNSEKKILYDAGKEYTYGELERQLDQICARLTKLEQQGSPCGSSPSKTGRTFIILSGGC